jgi:hypothetical protein
MTLGVGMNLDLDLSRMALLLRELNNGTKSVELGTRLGFHKSMVASIKSWASHMSLLADGGSLSCFGKQLISFDPILQHPASHLLLYYHLARNPKAEAFYYIVNRFLYDAVVLNRQFDAVELYQAAVQGGIGANSQATKQLDREIALMRRTLLRAQAFGPLGILSSPKSHHFAVHTPVLLPAFVAYAIRTEWQENAVYMSFHEFEQLGHLARVCLLTRPTLVNALKSAEGLGYLRVQEEARLDRVSCVPQWNTTKLLEVIYA